MALPTITSFTANTTIASSEVNTNFDNLRLRSDLNPSSGHIVLTPGTDKLVKIAVLRHDNTTDTYSNNTVILSGWGYVEGDGASDNITKAVSFGITFASAPVVVVGALALEQSTEPTAISDFDDSGGSAKTIVDAYNVSTTGFSVGVSRRDGAALTASKWWGFSWIAMGVLS